MSEVMLRRMRFDRLPATTPIQFHPIILAILNLASILKSLCEEIAKEVIVWGIFEAEVADIAEVLVQFLCRPVSIGAPFRPGTSLTRKAIA